MAQYSGPLTKLGRKSASGACHGLAQISSGIQLDNRPVFAAKYGASRKLASQPNLLPIRHRNKRREPARAKRCGILAS
jgi:hypothetical protein